MPRASPPLWRQLFELAPTPDLPLQARLRASIVQAILSGRLAEGAAMPSSRELAQALALSRNTVTAAYHQLVDEGFLLARSRRGVFVAVAASRVRVPAVAGATSGPPAPDWTRRVVRSLEGRPTLSKPARWRDYPYPFV